MSDAISYDDAIKLLPEGEEIHTFRSMGNVLVGSDWTRDELLENLKESPCIKISGPQAQAYKHGLAMKDGEGWRFIETKERTDEVKP